MDDRSSDLESIYSSDFDEPGCCCNEARYRAESTGHKSRQALEQCTLMCSSILNVSTYVTSIVLAQPPSFPRYVERTPRNFEAASRRIVQPEMTRMPVAQRAAIKSQAAKAIKPQRQTGSHQVAGCQVTGRQAAGRQAGSHQPPSQKCLCLFSFILLSTSAYAL